MGVLFSRTYLVYTAVKSDEEKVETKAPPIACEILDKKNKYLEGVCSAYGSCVMGSVQYFGYFCHGLSSGDLCKVETTEYGTVGGVCTEMGHCVNPQRQVRFGHLSCLGNTDVARDEDKDRGKNVKMDPVPDIVKHVDKNKGVSRKESMNIKYGSNENNDLHDGRGVKDNMNYVD